MSNKQQGWRLRFHFYPIRGNGLGEEESPHYHRWTLASKILAGGYINRDHQEGPITRDTAEEDKFYKYELVSSAQQTDSKIRTVTALSENSCEVVKRTVYAKGDVRHFPVSVPHSVQTFPEYFGTAQTLAITGKNVTNHSYSFKKVKGLSELPESRFEDTDDLIRGIDKQVTRLKLLLLSQQLNHYLRELPQS
jgi:hypothetical protein